MDERGDVITVAVSVADEGVFTTQLAIPGARLEAPPWRSIDEDGWTLETTVGMLVTDMLARAPEERALVLAKAAA
jgi:hypothetical protein